MNNEVRNMFDRLFGPDNMYFLNEALEIKKWKWPSNGNEDFRGGNQFAEAFMKFDNYRKEGIDCDVTLISGVDGTR